MDWILKGKELNHFIGPPPLNFDLADHFGQDLAEVCSQKILECRQRYEILEERKQFILELLDLTKPVIKPETDDFVRTMTSVACSTEQKIIQLWTKYWFLMKKKALRVEFANTNDITDIDIELASQHPYEDVYNGVLRLVGGKLIGLCPFHEEKTASFYIFKKDNYAKCFGCNWYGSVIDFIMQVEEIDFVEAVKRLR